MTDLERMQNVINWVARSASINMTPTMQAWFIGHIIAEAKDLDDGTPLKEPEVKS